MRSGDESSWLVNYEQYYELAERHGWRVTDLDWSQLAADAAGGLVSDLDRGALLGTAVIEHGVPHYSEVWGLVEDLRDNWDLWQFTTLWTGEEHRHSYALKKACDVLGIGDQIALDLAAVTSFRFAEAQKQSCADDCYKSVPGMLAYAIIQELATNHFYLTIAKRSASPFVKDLLARIAGDEMRHHVFYREALRAGFATTRDPVWYSDQVYRATRAFKMPHLIYELQVPFFEGGNWKIELDLQVQLARCFSFDPALLGRLIADYQSGSAGQA
jgi:Fatty acid desaturase